MVTYEDCLAFAGLTAEEVDLIAAHEHLPAIVALGLGSWLAGSAAGERRLRRMLGGRPHEAARARGERPRVAAAAAAVRPWAPETQAKRLVA